MRIDNKIIKILHGHYFFFNEEIIFLLYVSFVFEKIIFFRLI